MTMPARRTTISFIVTLAVVFVLVLATPTRALSIQADAPSQATVDTSVDLSLSLNLQPSETAEVQNISVTISGPANTTCVFESDGTVLEGCTSLSITPPVPSGFGYGFTAGNYTWNLTWNTTGLPAGNYTIDYFIIDTSGNVVLATSSSVTLTAAGTATINATTSGLSAQFTCNTNFAADTYDWDFGDGTVILDSTQSAVNHTYAASGTYVVSCSPWSPSESTTAFAYVSVDAGSQPPPPSNGQIVITTNGLTATLTCDTGFDGTYDWNFGDGAQMFDTTTETVNHTYSTAGTYEVSCTAWSAATGAETLTGYATVSGSTPPPPPPSGNSTVSVAETQEDGLMVTLQCNDNFGATSYDWNFGDGNNVFDQSSNTISYLYDAPGNYTVTCGAWSSAAGEAYGSTSVDVQGSGGGQVCSGTVFDMPATCTGGTIQVDTNAFGCRLLVCASGLNTTTVLACDKTAGYEMYLQSSTTSNPFTVCIGDACVGPQSGYAVGEYCSGGGSTNASVDLSVKAWYPKGNDYVFVCDANGFTATSYDWSFGDGQKLLGVSNSEVYHSYTASGNYTVSCTANDGTSATDTLNIVV